MDAGPREVDLSVSNSGRFSADEWLDGGGEKGGDGDGDEEKKYFRWPGPTLIGRGEGGVEGEDDGDA